jgi:hypothetical protein
MPELERLLKIHYADKSEAMIHAEKDFDPTERFLEKDLILITYRDLFRSEDRSPLASLAFFLEEAEERRGIINTINILPFFPYTFDRGFSMVDFRSVDPNLGSWRDIEEIGKRFKLMFDCVLNHASSKSLEILEMLNGKCLGARPHLAKTHMEIGKRFMEEKSQYKERDGISQKSIRKRQEQCFKRWIFNGTWMNWIRSFRMPEPFSNYSRSRICF